MSDLALNKKAYHHFSIEETFEAGIALTGTEVKSLKNHGGSLDEGYVRIKKQELWLINAHIAPYSFGTIHNHEPRRERKLLMHKKEILKLFDAVRRKGWTLIPLSFYVKRGKIKVKVGIASGKKKHDKRKALLEKEQERQIQRAFKHR